MMLETLNPTHQKLLGFTSGIPTVSHPQPSGVTVRDDGAWTVARILAWAYSLVGHFDIVRDEEDIHSTRRASLGHAGPRCMPSGHAACCMPSGHAARCMPALSNAGLPRLWPRCPGNASGPRAARCMQRGTFERWLLQRLWPRWAPLHAERDNFERCTAEAALNAGQNGVSQTLSGRCIIQL